MRLSIFVLLSMILSVGAVSVSQAQRHPDAVPDAKMQARIAELEKRVASLEARLTALTSNAPPTTQPAVAGVAHTDAKAVPLILDDWSFSSAQGDLGQSYYDITLKLRNAGTKPIKLIDASVQFTDLLDSHLYGIKVSPDLTIEPGKTDIDEGRYDINQFINEQARMRGMKKADIKATLIVSRLVFADNTVLKVEP